jgi:transcriptional regulator with XRE-family HTH domain
MRYRVNLIGPNVAKLRHQKGWTQDLLAARIQLSGYDITRQMIANIESRRSSISDCRIVMFAHVFNVGIGALFPTNIGVRI